MTKHRLNVSKPKVVSKIINDWENVAQKYHNVTNQDLWNELDVGHVLIGHMGLSYIMRMG